MTSDPRPEGLRLVFEDHFDGPVLDPGVWFPHYLPAWSSRAATAATYDLRDSCLRLFLPPGHGSWLDGVHTPPIRVSGIQSGNLSGPVGSPIGQQPWRAGMPVLEAQDRFEGWTPTFGYLEMRARAVISPRSMVAWWMIGLEGGPETSGEICVAEIFGDAVGPEPSAEVGMGLHTFRDPGTAEDFAAPRVSIDVAEFHTYAVDWKQDAVEFFIDGAAIRRCVRPPTYPMQMMLAVFDFPERSVDDDDDAVPELVIDVMRGYAR
ncbi:MAG TPA: glycoside hydrolase family 16 protein [Candidatus Saccharimonadales bacterium]|nr:glycoside hydrolase family 16 protein [Candidatus Saccharimonadales bacterium]